VSAAAVAASSSSCQRLTPAQLYRGTLLAMPFERTVSRLIEMHSEEYLASEHRP
jgi:predicted ATPase